MCRRSCRRRQQGQALFQQSDAGTLRPYARICAGQAVGQGEHTQQSGSHRTGTERGKYQESDAAYHRVGRQKGNRDTGGPALHRDRRAETRQPQRQDQADQLPALHHKGPAPYGHRQGGNQRQGIYGKFGGRRTV